jgi:hypothetical protein
VHAACALSKSEKFAPEIQNPEDVPADQIVVTAAIASKVATRLYKDKCTGADLCRRYVRACCKQSESVKRANDARLEPRAKRGPQGGSGDNVESYI